MAVEAHYRPELHRWSILLAAVTLLVVAGGYGNLMPPMEGGILYEHGPRMVAFSSDWWMRGRATAARHKAIGSIYHISFSPFVTAMILWVSLRILVHYGRIRELHLAATTLGGHRFLPGFPGIAVYMSRIAYAVQPMPLMITFTVFHVALAILVRRNVMAPAREFAASRIMAVS